MAKLEKRRKFIRSYMAKTLKSRSLSDQFADDMTTMTGTPAFLFFNVLFFTVWIVLNVHLIPIVQPFDPYPFGFLTLIVSLEAIILSIFVLISQNRSAYIGTIRDEIQMQVSLITEEEITKALQLLTEMRKKMDIKAEDPELNRMLDQTDTNYIEHSIVHQLEKANKPAFSQMIEEFPELFSSNSPDTKSTPAKKS